MLAVAQNFARVARLAGSVKPTEFSTAEIGKTREFAGENLCPEFRLAALEFFAWHDGQTGQPSNHL